MLTTSFWITYVTSYKRNYRIEQGIGHNKRCHNPTNIFNKIEYFPAIHSYNVLFFRQIKSVIPFVIAFNCEVLQDDKFTIKFLGIAIHT